MTTDTEQQQTFAIGERVVLHDISSRPELNGAAATVLDWHEESKRFAVQLDGGEAIKIKPSRLARPQAEAQVEPSQPPAAAQTKRHTDPSIFVNADGQFFQPLAPLAAPVLPRIHDAPTECRVTPKVTTLPQMCRVTPKATLRTASGCLPATGRSGSSSRCPRAWR